MDIPLDAGAAAAPRHLVVVAHGLGGSPGSVRQLADALRAAHGTRGRVLVHASTANFGMATSFFTTVQGVEEGGARLADEIARLAEAHPSLCRLSLVGFSLGGLYVRAAAPLVLARLPRLVPVNFISIASPHAGVVGHVAGVVEGAMRAGVLSRTGEDLTLTDRRGEHGLPLLVWMADPRSPHWAALARFPNRVAAANTVGDDKVPYWSAALAASPAHLRALSAGGASGGEAAPPMVTCHYAREPAGSSGGDGSAAAATMRRLRLPSATTTAVVAAGADDGAASSSAPTTAPAADSSPEQPTGATPAATNTTGGGSGGGGLQRLSTTLLSLLPASAPDAGPSAAMGTGGAAGGLLARFAAVSGALMAPFAAASGGTARESELDDGVAGDDPLSQDHIPMGRYPHVTAVHEQPPLQHADVGGAAASASASTAVGAADGDGSSSGIDAPAATPPPAAVAAATPVDPFAAAPPSALQPYYSFAGLLQQQQRPAVAALAGAASSSSSGDGSSSCAPPLLPPPFSPSSSPEARIIAGLRSMGGWVTVDVTFTEPWVPWLPGSEVAVNHVRIVDARPGLTGPRAASGGDVVRFLAEHFFLPTVSCPGKVLIAGGYLVTQEGVPGLVLSSTARFYCTAAITGGAGGASLAAALAAHDWLAVALAAPVAAAADASQPPTPLPVLVRSPQFHTSWRYAIDSASPAALRLTPAAADHRNTYVEWAVNVALLAVGGHMGAATLAAAIGALAAAGCTLELSLHADNDFYSQRAHLEAGGLPVTTANLATLPRFNPCPVDPATGKAVVNKTGLGSSAALVTSAVGAVLSLLGVVALGEGGSGDEGGAGRQYGVASRAASLRLVHDVAQTAHCLAQGKIGSGFDVCSASYGSVRYVRVPPAALEGVMEAVRRALGASGSSGSDDSYPRGVHPSWSLAGALLRAVSAPDDGSAQFALRAAADAAGADAPETQAALAAARKWRLDVSPFGLPSHLGLLLGDVCGGSETPGMVRDILTWKAATAAAEAAAQAAAGGSDDDEALLAPFAPLLAGAHGDARRAAAKAGIASAGTASTGVPRLWRQLAGGNALLEAVLGELRALEAGAPAPAGGAIAAAEDDAAAAFAIVRRLFRGMGEAASAHLGRPVPLEPAPQTELIDSLLAAPWPAGTAPAAADGGQQRGGPVLAAGVPGAGGYDAIFAITRRASGGSGGAVTIDALFGGAAPPTVSPCLCSCGPAMGQPGAGARLEQCNPTG